MARYQSVPLEPPGHAVLPANPVLPWLRRYTVSGWSLVRECVRLLWPAYLLASVLILVGITWAAPDGHYVGRSFQADENAAVYSVQHIAFPDFDPTVLRWGTGLFYQTYVAKLLVTLGGILPLYDRGHLLLGRAVVLVSALGTLTLTYYLGRRLFGTGTGRLAALLLAVLPGFVVSAHYFKPDVPSACWELAAVLAAYSVWYRPRRATVAVLGALVGYAASVKYSVAAVLLVGVIALVLGYRRTPRRIPWLLFALSTFGGFAFGDPYALLDPQRLLADTRVVAEVNSFGVPYVLGRPPALIDYALNVLPYAATLPVLVVAGVSLLLVGVRRGRKLLPIWAFIGGYLMLLAIDNTRLVRYTVPLLPLLALFVAAGLARLSAWPRFGKPLASIVTAGLIAYALVFSWSYVRVMAQVDPRVQASQWIEQNLPRGSVVAVSDNHYLEVPELQDIGDQPIEVEHSIEKLRTAATPYLVMTEMATRFYAEAPDKYPDEYQFFGYVRSNYSEVAHFENSQTILGINSKSGLHIAHDWLLPNPRITIMRRVAQPALQGP